MSIKMSLDHNKKEKTMSDAAVNVFNSAGIAVYSEKNEPGSNSAGDLSGASINQEYIIKDVVSDDEELKNFLLTLGCFKGETITVLSVLAENYVVSVKDARYSIDEDLAKAVLI
eukprot:Anaeramoba_ignava/a613287_3.p1 GENE.a613287_3~~a613287_3.p1  ORF type:complete len:114 (+),score=18.73 a613287_3:79-420(+)